MNLVYTALLLRYNPENKDFQGVLVSGGRCAYIRKGVPLFQPLFSPMLAETGVSPAPVQV